MTGACVVVRCVGAHSGCSITLSFDYNDDHPPGQTTFDKSNPLTTSSSYPGADPAGGSHALRLVCNWYIMHAVTHAYNRTTSLSTKGAGFHRVCLYQQGTTRCPTTTGSCASLKQLEGRISTALKTKSSSTYERTTDC